MHQSNESLDFPVGNNCIGIVLRGKSERDPLESMNSDHADCIIPNGHLYGLMIPREEYDNASRKQQIKMKGIETVIGVDDEQPSYCWCEQVAKRMKRLSTILLINVETRQAKAFSEFWLTARDNPRKYNRLSRNCATYCYEAFKHAGILTHLRHPLLAPLPVTPASVFHALNGKYSSMQNANLRICTGYLGLKRSRSGLGYDIRMIDVFR